MFFSQVDGLQNQIVSKWPVTKQIEQDILSLENPILTIIENQEKDSKGIGKHGINFLIHFSLLGNANVQYS